MKPNIKKDVDNWKDFSLNIWTKTELEWCLKELLFQIENNCYFEVTHQLSHIKEILSKPK